jgi:hypothetical protein
MPIMVFVLLVFVLGRVYFDIPICIELSTFLFVHIHLWKN